jgi:ubiquinone/menaquinone biosynthesis methyltransferase
MSAVPLPGEAGRGRAVREMFDRIAPTYDLLNRLLALRIDVRWRRKMIAALGLRPGERLLDLCAGTMDVAAEALRQEPGVRVTGADFALEMLRRGARKTGRPAANADALALPFPARTFEAVTVAFGVRNLESLDRGLAEMGRVLRPGGRVAILEFFRPERGASRFLHAAYNRLAVPLLGRAVSRDRDAYRYLVESMERFLPREEFEAALGRAGFAEVRGETLFPGVCGLVVARRPS